MLDPLFFLSPFAPWPAGLIALLALIYTAWADARTGTVPSKPLLAAAAILLAGICWQKAWEAEWQGMSWQVGRLLLPALAFYAAIWSLNMMWKGLYKHDALGMGDASWSMLACLAYGWRAVAFAWGAGAVIAILFLGTRKLLGKTHGHVYFVPFLLIGLIVERVLVLPGVNLW